MGEVVALGQCEEVEVRSEMSLRCGVWRRRRGCWALFNVQAGAGSLRTGSVVVILSLPDKDRSRGWMGRGRPQDPENQAPSNPRPRTRDARLDVLTPADEAPLFGYPLFYSYHAAAWEAGASLRSCLKTDSRSRLLFTPFAGPSRRLPSVKTSRSSPPECSSCGHPGRG